MKDPAFTEVLFESSFLGPPRSSGVYAICVSPMDSPLDQRVVYIGSSSCILKRVRSQNHIYRRLYRLLKNHFVVCKYMECTDYLPKEIELINSYKPRFNQYHING